MTCIWTGRDTVGGDGGLDAGGIFTLGADGGMFTLGDAGELSPSEMLGELSRAGVAVGLF